jgi:hypothetical protein
MVAASILVGVVFGALSNAVGMTLRPARPSSACTRSSCCR